MNKLLLMGRFVADPEFSQNQSGTAICRFRIAVDRQYSKNQEKISDFFQLVSFGNTAEFVSKYFFKGKTCLIEGRIQNNNYQDKDGKMQYQNQIIADRVMFTLSDSTSTRSTPPFNQNPVQNDFSEFESISGGEMPF